MRIRMFDKRRNGRNCEQRSEPRYHLSSMVTWRCGDTKFTGQAHDICRGGMRISCSKRVPLKELVLLLTIGSIPIDMTGQIKWVSRIKGSYKFGVAFVSVTRDQMRYLEENCLDELTKPV